MAHHILNLNLLLCLAYLTNALLSVLLAGSGQKFRGAWWWVLGQSLMATGTLGDALAPFLPGWLPLIFGNTAYAAAFLFYSRAVWIFRHGTAFPRWTWVLPPVQAASFALACQYPYLVQTSVFSFWMSLGPLVSAWLLLWRPDRRLRWETLLTALPFLILGLASLSRLAVLGSLAARTQVEAASSQNVWYTGGAILLSTVMLFGYFLMCSTRNLQLLQEKDGEIEKRNLELEHAAKNKDLFFAIIAHDIRGPIGGAARYVRKNLFGRMSGFEERYTEVDTLAQSLERTNEYLEKLLWWSKAQLRDWKPVCVSLDVAPSVSRAIAMLSTQAELKRIAIRQEPATGIMVLADPDCLQLILHNVLSNAVKYSHQDGMVTVAYAQDQGYCTVAIRDEGVGMAPELLERLFHIEDKVSLLGTQRETGNGLGLILAKSLADRSGCTIHLCSEPGKGTTATLGIPLAAAVSDVSQNSG